ncbi:MAG: hypothetical protein KGP14_00380 [Betaproteobacteria bacterium]|nr:hypothetical protein [Betaproteobacteria bacterium]
MKLTKVSTSMRNLAIGAFVSLSMASPAFAGGDATFQPITNRIDGWLNGSLGYLIALVAFLIGVVNAIRGERGLWTMVFPFFLSIIITVGISVISGGFTAMI